MNSPSEPLLSICIPTYDRAHFLRQTLDTVLVALGRVTVPCELLVCDNASPDETPSVLEEFRRLWPALKIFRNPENIGEMNFYTTMHHATGKYVWLLGDDDLVEPDFLAVLLPHLRDEPELVVCNHSIHSVDFTQVYRVAFHPRSAPARFASRDEVLGTFGISLGFISAAVIRRDRLLEVSKGTFERFSVYGLSFFSAVCTALTPRARVIFLNESLIRYRGGNSTINWENVFVNGVQAALEYLGELGYSPRAVRRAKRHAVRRYLTPRLVHLKKEAISTNPLLSRAISVFSGTPEFYLLAVPLALTPPIVFSIWHRFRRRR